MEPIVLKELTKIYGAKVAVNALSFSISSQTIFGLLGANGAGKTTTFKMLATLLPPSAGTAAVGGYDILKEPNRVRRQIGYVSQNLTIDLELTGRENLKLAAILQGLAPEKMEERIAELVEFMELGTHINQVCETYSGGMARRLDIAQALIHNPALLILDEPTAGLDPEARRNVWVCLDAWRAKSNGSILLSTHSMDEAETLCDQIAFLQTGHLVAMDTPKELKKKIGVNATLDDVFVYYKKNRNE